MTSLAGLLDNALVALAAGNRRILLELVRDEPEALALMARQFSMSAQDVAHDLSKLHTLEYEQQHDGFARRYDPILMRAARLVPGSAVLDVGCGSGVSSRDAARAVGAAGSVLGVDASGPLVKRAAERSRLEGLTNTRFEHGDVQVFPFEPASVDVGISRLGAMYFEDPVTAFANIARSLRPAGRLALLAWQGPDSNDWVSAIGRGLGLRQPHPEPAIGAPGIFGLADEAATRQVLGAAGFADLGFEDVHEPVEFGVTVDDAFAFVSTLSSTRDVLAPLDTAERRAALQALRTTLAAHETDDGVLFSSSAWIITGHRR